MSIEEVLRSLVPQPSEEEISSVADCLRLFGFTQCYSHCVSQAVFASKSNATIVEWRDGRLCFR